MSYKSVEIHILFHGNVSSLYYILSSQLILAQPSKDGLVFELGQQHDSHELLNMLLEDLARKGMFAPALLQWDSRCLGACDVSVLSLLNDL